MVGPESQSGGGGWDPTGYSMANRVFKPVEDRVGNRDLSCVDSRQCVDEFGLRDGGPTVQRHILFYHFLFLVLRNVISR